MSSILFSTEKLYRDIEAALTPADKKDLQNLADEMMKLPLQSVTMSKLPRPEGATLHDHITIGKYNWPNPDTPSGLPWVLRDGLTNPWLTENNGHAFNMRMLLAVTTLGAAGHFLHKQEYFVRAAEHLKYYFINSETAANPDLRFVHSSDIIVMHFLSELLETVRTFPEFPEWNTEDQNAFKEWCTKYLDFLLNHPNGKKESEESNNHGAWLDVQVISLALYLDREDIAIRQIKEVSIPRMDGHFTADLRLIQEEHRTISLFYTYFSLQGWAWIAGYAERLGIDLLHTPNKHGATLLAVLRNQLDYFFYRKPWPLLQLKGRPRPIEYTRLFSMFAHFDALPECEEYLKLRMANPIWRLPAIIPEESYQQYPPEPCDWANIPEDQLDFLNPEQICDINAGCPNALK